jgi:hypothetical protein
MRLLRIILAVIIGAAALVTFAAAPAQAAAKQCTITTDVCKSYRGGKMHLKPGDTCLSKKEYEFCYEEGGDFIWIKDKTKFTPARPSVYWEVLDHARGDSGNRKGSCRGHSAFWDGVKWFKCNYDFPENLSATLTVDGLGYLPVHF